MVFHGITAILQRMRALEGSHRLGGWIRMTSGWSTTEACTERVTQIRRVVSGIGMVHIDCAGRVIQVKRMGFMASVWSANACTGGVAQLERAVCHGIHTETTWSPAVRWAYLFSESCCRQSLSYGCSGCSWPSEGHPGFCLLSL